MKKYLIAFLSTLLFSTNVFSQLKKGDWSFSLLGNVSVAGQVDGDFDYTSSRLHPSAGRMLTDNLMVGSGIGLFSSNGLGDNSPFLSTSNLAFPLLPGITNN